MKVLKLLLFCWCWMFFVVITKGQSVDTSTYYQVIERDLEAPNSLAQIIIKNKKGQVLVLSKSSGFDRVKGGQIQAQNTRTTLYLYQLNGQVDSITHPEVDFKYVINTKTLFLEIPSQGNHPNFYSNSLHKIDIRAQKIEWRMLEDQLYLDNKEAAICFTSIHHFDASLMEAYQSLGNTNPLVKMGLYVQKKGNLKAWFGLKEMTLLFDKHLDNIILMDSTEIRKAARNPAFKIIKQKQDFELFKKGYPSIFRFAGMDVEAVQELIDTARIDERTALPLYLKMVKDGFLDYDATTKQVQLQDKLFHYVAAMNRQSEYDYDHLKFWSRPILDSIGRRVCLNLATQALVVPNVHQIVLGSTQQVIAKPFRFVQILPNRTLKFNGQLLAGNAYFQGTDFSFEYDTYRALLSQINQLNIAIYKRIRLKNEWSNEVRIGRERAFNEKGEPTEEVEFIQSIIEGGKGYLQIGKVNNKSGKNKEAMTLPFFVSNSKSDVYYDKCSVDGVVVYPRNSFYYELAPFQLDKVKSLRIEQVFFKGKFYSSSIFPVFENALSLQFYDLSLGFDTLITKAEKVPVYLREEQRGKGVFYGQLKLSNGGLKGNGTLTYLGASLVCDVFDFFPERLEAKQVDSFSLEASKQFPKVKAKQIKMLWEPYENRMRLSSLFTEGFPFHLYYKAQKYRLDGQLIIKPKGLFGRGTLDWQQASMVSNPEGDYEIGRKFIRSTSVDILLKMRGRHQFGFEQQNAHLKLNFEEETARFISQDTNPIAVFPYNACQTTFNQFEWNWKENVLFMKSKDSQKGVFKRAKIELEYFNFEANKGVYDLNTGLLQLKNLAPVKIGNAFLYLKDSILEIDADAYIQKLEGKLVIGDTIHPIYIVDALELIWDVNTASFLSKGASFEVKKGNGKTLQLVKGKIEVLPTKEGFEVTYAWIFPNEDWIFLIFEKGAFQAISNFGRIDAFPLAEVKDFEQFRKKWLND